MTLEPIDKEKETEGIERECKVIKTNGIDVKVADGVVNKRSSDRTVLRPKETKNFL